MRKKTEVPGNEGFGFIKDFIRSLQSWFLRTMRTSRSIRQVVDRKSVTPGYRHISVAVTCDQPRRFWLECKLGTVQIPVQLYMFCTAPTEPLYSYPLDGMTFSEPAVLDLVTYIKPGDKFVGSGKVKVV